MVTKSEQQGSGLWHCLVECEGAPGVSIYPGRSAFCAPHEILHAIRSLPVVLLRSLCELLITHKQLPTCSSILATIYNETIAFTHNPRDQRSRDDVMSPLDRPTRKFRACFMVGW